jgi:hypothetical protein
MLDVIRNLLKLQDQDRRILQIRAELNGFAVQRQVLQGKLSDCQAKLEAIRNRLMHVESERKKLELEVEARSRLIEKYALQQFQTKKNEEYRALTHEIELCKQAISKFEDQQLEFMEQADLEQKALAEAGRVNKEMRSLVDAQGSQLDNRERELTAELASLIGDRNQLTAAIEEPHRARYERLLKQRGEKVMVGIDHGVCAGCHMKLPPQTLITCQSDEEIVSCPNCGRILFYTPEMDLANPEI